MIAPHQHQDCYLLETGTPTLTVRLQGREEMIPWAGFAGGTFQLQESKKNEKIELRFQEWQLTLTGNDLQKLWEKCQMQDLRWVQAIPAAVASQWAGDCVVTRVEMRLEES